MFVSQAVNKMTNILGSGVNQAMTPLYDDTLVSVIKSQATLAPSLAGVCVYVCVCMCVRVCVYV